MTVQIQIIDIQEPIEKIPQCSGFSAIADAIAYVPFRVATEANGTRRLEEITQKIACIIPLDTFHVENLKPSANVVFDKSDGGIHSQTFIRVFLNSAEDLFLFKLNFPKKKASNFSA